MVDDRFLTRLLEKKRSLIENESSLDKYVASAVTPVTPITKLKKGTFISKTAQVDASIPDDHPLKGLATYTKDRFRKEALAPENANKSANEVLTSIVQDEYNKVGDAPYTYKREADSSLLNILGIEREDNKIAKPPEYDEWLAAQRTKEAENEHWFNGKEWAEDLGKSALMGAVIGGVTGALGTGVASASILGTLGGLAGTALGPVGTAVGVVGGVLAGSVGGEAIGTTAGAIAGAAGFAAFEAGNKVLGKLIDHSEWYKANMNSGSALDKAQALGLSLGTGLAGGIVVEKKFSSLYKKVISNPVKDVTGEKLYTKGRSINVDTQEKVEEAKAINDLSEIYSKAVAGKGEYKPLTEEQIQHFISLPDEAQDVIVKNTFLHERSLSKAIENNIVTTKMKQAIVDYVKANPDYKVHQFGANENPWSALYVIANDIPEVSKSYGGQLKKSADEAKAVLENVDIEGIKSSLKGKNAQNKAVNTYRQMLSGRMKAVRTSDIRKFFTDYGVDYEEVKKKFLDDIIMSREAKKLQSMNT